MLLESTQIRVFDIKFIILIIVKHFFLAFARGFVPLVVHFLFGYWPESCIYNLGYILLTQNTVSDHILLHYWLFYCLFSSSFYGWIGCKKANLNKIKRAE